MAQGVRARQQEIQDAALEAIRDTLPKTGRSLCVVPTGGGKTYISARAAKEAVDAGGRVIYIAHKWDLLEQAMETFKAVGFTESQFGVVAGDRCEISGDVLFCMIQKASRPNVLGKLSAYRPTLLVVDECHHSTSRTFERVLALFPSVPRLGVTATPDRADTRSAREVFGEPAIQISVLEALSRKIYADPRDLSRVILTNSVLEGIVAPSGDYAPSALDKLVVSTNRNQIIVESYKKHGAGLLRAQGRTPKTICFCINVAHAVRMVELFRSAGITADFVVGNEAVMSREKREEVLERFKTTDETEILCVVQLLVEGTDIEMANCLVLCRPTRSAPLYTQMIGRGARYRDGEKETFVVLDYVDVTRKKGFGNYILSNATKTPYRAEDQIVTEYVTVQDPVVVNERVDAIKAMVDYEPARREWYATIEEWVEACRKLGLTNQKTYRTRYKEDPRLPSSPEKVYSNFSFSLLSNAALRQKWTFEACLAAASKFSTILEWAKRYSGSHLAARRNGWMEQIREHAFPNARRKEPEKKKADLLEMARRLGRRLSQCFPEEKALEEAARLYCNPKLSTYDADFQTEYQKYPTYAEWKKQQKLATAKNTTGSASPVDPDSLSSTDEEGAGNE
jgi:superfamily II DNA or RNA helicase